MKNIKVPLSVNGLKDLSNKINNLKPIKRLYELGGENIE